MIIIEDFIRVLKNDIYKQHGYESYKSLVKAKLACSSDKRCFGVYDGNCDTKGNFGLCKGSINRPKTTKTHYTGCVYKKKELHGMYGVANENANHNIS